MQSVYLSKGRELLKLLINNGFEGYFVGECVRNTIMNIDFSRSDIVTNARIDDLKRINNYIFNDSATYIDDNTIKVVYNDYDFYFKSFSALENQMNDNRTKLTKHYSSNLLDELATRDFTIDAIAMSYSGKVTDAYNGVDDIKAKRIRTITNPKIRFNNYPLEILGAIKLVGELKFQVSDKTYQAMVKKAKLLITQNKEEIFNYMDAILHAKYSKKAFAYLLSRGIYKNIPSLDKGLKAISHTNKDISIEELLLASFVLNGEIDRDYKTALYWFNLSAQQNYALGQNAVGYLRFRKDGLGDIGRTQRQQFFLKAFFIIFPIHLAMPSLDLRKTLPVNPSITTTSASPLKTSLPSI